MPINWKDAANQERLVAALVASLDCKPDIRKVAYYFGQEVKYDAVEFQLRTHKKLARTLKTEAEAEGREMDAGKQSKPATPRKPKTPKKDVADRTVLSGRVTKDGSPRKPRARKNTVKKEEALEDELQNNEDVLVKGEDGEKVKLEPDTTGDHQMEDDEQVV